MTIRKLLIGCLTISLLLVSSALAVVHLDGVPLPPLPPLPTGLSIEARTYTIRFAAAHAKATPGIPPKPSGLKITKT